jgi:hypothetical protein
MRLEDGQWRVTELQWLGYPNKFVIDDPGFVEQFRRPEQKQNESSATNVLRRLHNVLATYAATYPEVGLPPDLVVLGSAAASSESSSDNDVSDFSADDAEHAGLLENNLAVNQFESNGYVFRYELQVGGLEGAYSISARPAQYGKAATRSFYMNESGEIHNTVENREATAEDEPFD